MAQRYTDPRALDRMAEGTCPECGTLAEKHINDNRFWVPRGCSLTAIGVADRIAQYREDVGATSDG